ncbi:MAG: hypothetical protein JWP87_6471 [Labilithrix sp.]|nr:hypothetical protein [Labilithrix sp.]
MSTKPRSEKRTMTEPGLGKVPGTEPRRTTMRERIGETSAGAAPGSVPPASAPPISAPPPSGPPPESRGVPRTMTRALESTPPVEKKASKPPHDARLEPDDEGSPRSERGRRTPIEVTQVDTKRIPKQTTPKPPPVSRPPTKPNSRPPNSRAAEPQRPDASRFAAEEIPTGRRPIARSNRMSIREDNVGVAATRAADAVGVATRMTPKLVKTRAEIAAAPIDHRAGFLIAHIDGVTTVQGLVDIAGMPEEEVQEILERLRRLGIVALR